MRRTKILALASALTGLVAMAVPSGPAAAQQDGLRDSRSERAARPVRVRPRIVVTPTQRLYRQCVDVYVIEHRLTGDTVVPDMRCRWAYR